MPRNVLFVTCIATVVQSAGAQFPIRVDFIVETFEFDREDPVAYPVG